MKIYCLNLSENQILPEDQQNIKQYFNNDFIFYNQEKLITTQEDIINLINQKKVSPKYIRKTVNNKALYEELNYYIKHIEIWKQIIDQPAIIYRESYSFDLEKYLKCDFDNEKDIIYCNNLCEEGISYYITPKGAKKLLENTLYINSPLDIYINNQCKNNIYNYDRVNSPFISRNDNINHIIRKIDFAYHENPISVSEKNDFIKLKKIAIIGSHPNLSTGYAKIGAQIANELSNYLDVIYLGYQNTYPDNINRNVKEDIKVYDLYEIDRESPLSYGDKAIMPILQQEEPDYIIIYSDHGACSAILRIIESFNCYKMCYLDLVYEYQHTENIEFIKNNCDKVIAFSDSWKSHLMDFYKIDNITTLYHGIIKDDELLSKEELGFDKDDFIVLSLNRNDKRKNIDIVIAAFLEFLKQNLDNIDRKIYLFINCLLDSSLDIRKFIILQCKILKINPDIATDRIRISNKCGRETDKFIHSLYKNSDVGISVTSGEGFGLTVIEHLNYGKPVICPKIKIFEELIGEHYPYFIKPLCSSYSYDILGGVIYHYDKNDVVEKLNQIYNMDSNILSLNFTKKMEERFKWETIIKKFVIENINCL